MPSHPRPAILTTSPSSMAVFSVLVTTRIADFHTLASGQQTRTMTPTR